MNALAGKRLYYRIGANSSGEGADNVITVVPYGKPLADKGISIGYCNLLDQRDNYNAKTNTGHFGPYLEPTGTAEEYGEGVPDPNHKGWLNNLVEQFELRRDQSFEYIELDNPDAFMIVDVIRAINLAFTYGLKVIAKNPLEMDGIAAARAYVKHENVYGCIVEKGCGSPRTMQDLRRSASKPDLPIRFVAFGRGRQWANDTVKSARDYKDMGVTYSTRGEYENAIDLLIPR